ncbi:SRPBCC domain-containing protein [Aliivibrio kagoshimensis]|uniref:SRPBCC domain-containing protein n=1 Tax=Aliivibrio kagoshimensis TaxID=2910230 RepID=UPI003D0E84B4
MTIHQELTLHCSKDKVFSALTDSNTFAKFTGAPAVIDACVGGEFSCFNDMISGVTVDIVADNYLVQAWRAGTWDSNVFSIVKIELIAVSEQETRLLFEHKGYPEDQKEHLCIGWHERYWKPMTKYVEAT